MSKAKITSVTVRVPAGTYWVGDPCYGVPNNVWIPLLDSCGYFNNPIGTVAGFEVIAFGTHHGDGVYKDRQGREYGVDAGLIGLVPVGAFPDPEEGLMHKIEFKRSVLCGVEDGVITFGDIAIDTGDEWLTDDNDDGSGYIYDADQDDDS